MDTSVDKTIVPMITEMLTAIQESNVMVKKLNAKAGKMNSISSTARWMADIEDRFPFRSNGEINEFFEHPFATLNLHHHISTKYPTWRECSTNFIKETFHVVYRREHIWPVQGNRYVRVSCSSSHEFTFQILFSEGLS